MGNRLVIISLAILAAATVIGLVLLRPGALPQAQESLYIGEEVRLYGTVETIVELENDGLLPNQGLVNLQVSFAINNAEETNTPSPLTLDIVDDPNLYRVGLPIVLNKLTVSGQPPQYSIVDIQRSTPLIWLCGSLVVAVIILGRWQGVRSLISLAVSGVVVVGWLVPGLMSGRSPMGTSLVAALAVMGVSLLLTHGWNPATRAAALGTAVALIGTVLLASATVWATSLTGLTDEDVQHLRFVVTTIDPRGLLLAGIIIGTLGVLDDVTVSQAATVAALRRAAPQMPAQQIFNEALRVGRDHIAATVNTLFLAYAGASLPLLMLFTVGEGPIAEIVTSEVVTQEIVRTVVGSLGLILAVPVTTAIAAATIDADTAQHASGHTHCHDMKSDFGAGDNSPSSPPTETGAALKKATQSPVSVTRSTNDAASSGLASSTLPKVANDGAEQQTGASWEDALRGRYGLDNPERSTASHGQNNAAEPENSDRPD